MFAFLDARTAKKFGIEMAFIYMERMPLHLVLKEKQFTVKSQKILEKMSLQITSYKKLNTLNIYKVAQMGNAFKWALKDAGYEDAYINKLTQWFITKVKT